MTDQEKQAILTKWENHQEDVRIEASDIAGADFGSGRR